MPDLAIVKTISTIVAGAVTTFALLFALYEFRRKNRVQRAEIFLELRRKFKGTEMFPEIIAGLDADEDLSGIEQKHRLRFLGFLEEVALMVNSKLLSRAIADEMFGFYVRKAESNDSMWWEGNERDSRYRFLFKWLHAICLSRHLSDKPQHMKLFKF